ncbi:DUF5809 family protein [Halovivax limisalsi]|uniref:DUF5809 family protein n=1 Tax=Halovivax limisalsi TaxID=1453760 RepID=UPI001FFC8ABD|nr:DUF5809 family protein [Halovivax limisalsi]
METEGFFDPSTVEEAREYYEGVGPTARTTVREVARAMDFDRDEYDDRVTSEVVATARDATFAGLLAVTVGSRDAYDEWRDAYDGEVHEIGHEAVDRVAWHAGPAGEAVAATFQDEPEAAVATLRRQAFGRIYRPLFETED